MIYGLSGALCLLALLWIVPVWWPVKAWAMGEELLTAGCSAVWLAWPEWFTHAFADEQVRQVNERIHREKPSTLLSGFVKAIGGLMVFFAFLGLMYEVAITLHAVRQSIVVPVTKP